MLNFISTINLIIAIQSIFLTIHFLLKKKGTIILNRIMSVMTFCFGIVVFNTYYTFAGFEASDILQDVANNVMWFVGPAIYVYITYKTDLFSKDLIAKHFIPYLFPAIFDIFFDWKAYDQIIPFIGLSQMLIYLSISIRLAYRDYKDKQSYFSWILPFVVVFTLLVIMNFALNISASLDVFYLASSVRQSFTTLLIIPVFYLSFKEMNAEKDFGLQKEKYKTTMINDEKAQEYIQKIDQYLVNEEAYKILSLTLRHVSDHTDIPTKYISQVINQVKEMRFTDYLMDLRIEEAKRRLRDPASQHLSIIGISSECGFASGSRFNHQFKKQVGQTPSEFRMSNEEF